MALHKKRDTAQAVVDDLQKRIIDTISEHWETATAELELELAIQVLDKAQNSQKQRESNGRGKKTFTAYSDKESISHKKNECPSLEDSDSRTTLVQEV